MIISMLIETGKFLAVLAVLAGILMTYPRTRRVVFAVAKFSKANMSPWMLAVSGACFAIPGFVDELVILPVLLAIMLRTHGKRVAFAAAVAAAWQG